MIEQLLKMEGLFLLINVESADIKDVLLKIVEHADRHDRKVFTIHPIDDDRLSLDKSGDMYLLSLKSQE